jgi:hypothetical protein
MLPARSVQIAAHSKRWACLDSRFHRPRLIGSVKCHLIPAASVVLRTLCAQSILTVTFRSAGRRPAKTLLGPRPI